ncbi:MAG: formate dehydrogenase subunit delta [Sinobacteraceae bacterium]|nr:formate dehydrogenase subunit delta [Nevskiaceae bacterium]
MSGGADQLVKMANDIGHFFRAQPKREDAVLGIANHIHSFWTVRMRQKLLTRIAHGDARGLEDLPRAAMQVIAERESSLPPPPPGGDAG